MSMDNLFLKRPRLSLCRFGTAYSELDDADREKLNTAFRDTEITTTWIWTVLNENGFNVSESTVRTHRKRLCRTCGNDA